MSRGDGPSPKGSQQTTTLAWQQEPAFSKHKQGADQRCMRTSQPAEQHGRLQVASGVAASAASRFIHPHQVHAACAPARMRSNKAGDKQQAELMLQLLDDSDIRGELTKACRAITMLPNSHKAPGCQER